MLKDLQDFLAKRITLRSSEIFGKTSVYHCVRGMSEYSLDWSTPGEEDLIRSSLDIIYRFASRLDDSVTLFENRVDNFYFAYCYEEFSVLHKRIPKFTVNPNIRGLTGELSPKTGICICADDPNASLQFVWTTNGGAQLRKSNTFNEIGLAALRYVGRNDHWFEGKNAQFCDGTSVSVTIYRLYFNQWNFIAGPRPVGSGEVSIHQAGMCVAAGRCC